MENLNQIKDREQSKPYFKNNPRDEKKSSVHSNEAGKISLSSAQVIDEIVKKRRTALEILANR